MALDPTIDLESVIQKQVDLATAEPTDEPEDDVDAEETPAEPVVADTPEEPVPAAPADEPPVQTDKVADPAKPEAPKPQEDAFAKEHGLDAKGKDGRPNRIPYPRVVKIAENAVAKAKVSWEKEHLEPIKAKVAAYEERLSEIDRFEKIMLNDQPRFLAILSTLPGYAELLNKPASEPAKPEPAAQPPAPDAKMADGTLGYSPEGLQNLLKWNAEQARLAAVKDAEAAMTKRFGPIEERFKRVQAVEEFEAATLPKLQAQYQNAFDTWDGFKENEAEILKALQEDSARAEKAGTQPQLTLEGAYRVVMIPKWKAEREKLSTDREKVRKEVLDEINKAPKSTSAPSTGAVNPKAATVRDPNAPPDLEDTIRRAIAPLKV